MCGWIDVQKRFEAKGLGPKFVEHVLEAKVARRSYEHALWSEAWSGPGLNLVYERYTISANLYGILIGCDHLVSDKGKCLFDTVTIDICTGLYFSSKGTETFHVPLYNVVTTRVVSKFYSLLSFYCSSYKLMESISKIS